MKRHLEWLLGLVVAGIYVAVLAATASDIGFVRDEGYYFKAAREYFGWFGALWSDPAAAFTQAVIDEHFEYNHEHPALVKLVQGALHALFHDTLGWTTSAQGFRWAGFLYGGLTVFGTCVLGRMLVGPGAGVVAAVFLTCLPRFFFDAHLACFDVPVTAMWVWSLIAFGWMWSAPRGRVLGRAVATGVVFGLAVATKLNAFFLPAVFITAWLVDPPSRPWPRWVPGPSGRRELILAAIPWSLIVVAFVGAATFFATWPWLWPDLVARTNEYLRFHLGHEHYPISYFGVLYVQPPFPMSFPWVMTLFTVPVAVLVMAVGGGLLELGRARQRPVAVAVLWVATLLPILMISLPNTPIFGGTKHWYNALPTMCIAGAAVVIRGGAALVDGGWRRGGLQAVATLVVALSGWVGAARVHPNNIGYYNALAGGVRGAAEMGMQRAFWGTVTFPLIRRLPELTSKGRVFFNRANFDSYRKYQDDGVIPRGYGYGNDARGVKVGYTFAQPEHGETEADIWANIGTRPVDGVYQDNVTLGQVYVKGQSDRPPAPDSESAGASTSAAASP